MRSKLSTILHMQMINQSNAQKWEMVTGTKSVILDESQDLSLENIEKSFEKIQVELEKFGLSTNQSKVYMFLGKYGTKTASEINQALKIPRTETYHILSTLQSKGIVSAMFGHPVKFTAIEITNAMTQIINSEKQKIRKLENQKTSLIKLWKTVPVGNNEENIEEKFQMLQGENQINSKINEMTNTQKEILIIGNEKDFADFYHTNILDNIEKLKKFRILTTSTKINYVYENINKENVKVLPEQITDNLCYIIKDNEVLFYLKNNSKKESTAMWTNSSAMNYSKKLLFEELWEKSKEMKK
ncbi:TrmB family transcriptional regulator [Nitrosopumilus sp.]|uniref:TrmB family transcriptional regulator n=1 Tax=Nitrosopumilus sp. TaxID=2024843 RepID=UPI003D10648E